MLSPVKHLEGVRPIRNGCLIRNTLWFVKSTGNVAFLHLKYDGMFILNEWYAKILHFAVFRFLLRFVRLYMGRVKRIRLLSLRRAAKIQACLRIRAVSPEPPLLAHTSNESKGNFRQKARSLAPLNGWS